MVMHHASSLAKLVSLALGSTLIFGLVSGSGGAEVVVLLELVNRHGLGDGSSVMFSGLMVRFLDGNGSVGDAWLDGFWTWH